MPEQEAMEGEGLIYMTTTHLFTIYLDLSKESVVKTTRLQPIRHTRSC